MKLRIIITIASMLTLSACVSVGRKLDTAKIDEIKKGETTRQQVLKLLGSPDQITKDGSGNVTFQYMHVRATPKAESFIPVVGMFAGGANVQNQLLMVTFGKDEVVTDLISTYGASESGVGASAGSKADLKGVEENKRPK